MVTELTNVTELTLAETLHALPLLLHVSVEANCQSCLTEITDGKTLTELTTVMGLTVAVTVHPLPLLLPVSVDAD